MSRSHRHHRPSALQAVRFQLAQRRRSRPMVPLVRFLRSRRGRRWDTVYAEIAAHLPFDGPQGERLDDMLRDLVHRRVVRDGGEVFGLDRDGRPTGRLVSTTGWVHRAEFYVDPVDRTLREAPVDPARPTEDEPVTRVDRGAGLWFIKRDGIWYGVQTRPLAKTTRPFDRLLCAPAEDGNADVRRALYGTARRFAVSKKQLDRRTLRKAGLENDR